MRPYAIPYRCLFITLKNADSKIKSSHCLQLLPNLSSIGTRGRACDAHRPDILVSVILGKGLLGLDLPSIRLFGGDGWIRTTALFRGEIYSLVQSTTLPRLQKKSKGKVAEPSVPLLGEVLRRYALTKTLPRTNKHTVMSVVFFCPVIPLFVAIEIKKFVCRCF